jgi:hypothetical protein
MLDLRTDAEAHRFELPALQHLYADVRATWHGRMVNEHASASVFAGLAEQIRRAELDATWAQQCEAFADEERLHGILCGAVVEAAGGEAIAPDAEREPFPYHDEVSPLEALLRNLISVSCLSETAAVALIGAERLRMPDGPLRSLMSRIYGDEVGHARFGWQLVAELAPRIDPAMARRLSAYLALAFAHFEAHELRHLPASYHPPDEGHALGLCSGSDARALLYKAVDEVMIPGLAALGFDAERAWRLRHASRDSQ